MLIDYVVHTTSEAKQIAGETGVTHEEKNTYLKNRRYYFDAVTKTMVRSMSVLDSGYGWKWEGFNITDIRSSWLEKWVWSFTKTTRKNKFLYYILRGTSMEN